MESKDQRIDSIVIHKARVFKTKTKKGPWPLGKHSGPPPEHLLENIRERNIVKFHIQKTEDSITLAKQRMNKHKELMKKNGNEEMKSNEISAKGEKMKTLKKTFGEIGRKMIRSISGGGSQQHNET